MNYDANATRALANEVRLISRKLTLLSRRFDLMISEIKAISKRTEEWDFVVDYALPKENDVKLAKIAEAEADFDSLCPPEAVEDNEG